jgi:hypothetical protein
MTTTTSPAQPIRGYTTSIRTLRGRLVLHVDRGALLKLGASDLDEATLLTTLQHHISRLHALALQLAAPGCKSEVTVGASDVGETPADSASRRSEHLRHR